MAKRKYFIWASTIIYQIKHRLIKKSTEVCIVWNFIKTPLPIVKKAIQLYNSTPQTEQPDSGWSLGDIVADQKQKGPEAELLETDNLTHVYKMLETMDPREATILRMRFGLDDAEPKTLKEIGESLGLTRERVRQIETEALNRLARGLTGD